jgi:hypothetical protein
MGVLVGVLKLAGAAVALTTVLVRPWRARPAPPAGGVAPDRPRPRPGTVVDPVVAKPDTHVHSLLWLEAGPVPDAPSPLLGIMTSRPYPPTMARQRPGVVVASPQALIAPAGIRAYPLVAITGGRRQQRQILPASSAAAQVAPARTPYALGRRGRPMPRTDDAGCSPAAVCRVWATACSQQASPTSGWSGATTGAGANDNRPLQRHPARGGADDAGRRACALGSCRRPSAPLGPALACTDKVGP